MEANKFKNGVVSKGGEFFIVETEEERLYLEELHEECMMYLEMNDEDEDDENFEDGD